MIMTHLVYSSGGELLEMRLLNSHLLNTFGSKSIARHKFYQLLELQMVDKGFGKCQLLDTIYSKENGVHVRQLG